MSLDFKQIKMNNSQQSKLVILAINKPAAYFRNFPSKGGPKLEITL